MNATKILFLTIEHILNMTELLKHYLEEIKQGKMSY